VVVKSSQAQKGATFDQSQSDDKGGTNAQVKAKKNAPKQMNAR